MMASEKNIQLLRKIAALAERGVGGEKDTAQKKLAKLMQKYGVSDADLEGDEVDYHEFRYSGENERQILRQIFYQINHDREVRYIRAGRGSRSTLFFVCTEAEAVEARVKFEFYRELWKDEVGFLLKCFIQKHELFRRDPDAPIGRLDPETEFRMCQMINGMQDRTFARAIGYSGDHKI